MVRIKAKKSTAEAAAVPVVVPEPAAILHEARSDDSDSTQIMTNYDDDDPAAALDQNDDIADVATISFDADTSSEKIYENRDTLPTPIQTDATFPDTVTDNPHTDPHFDDRNRSFEGNESSVISDTSFEQLYDVEGLSFENKYDSIKLKRRLSKSDKSDHTDDAQSGSGQKRRRSSSHERGERHSRRSRGSGERKSRESRKSRRNSSKHDGKDSGDSDKHSRRDKRHKRRSSRYDQENVSSENFSSETPSSENVSAENLHADYYSYKTESGDRLSECTLELTRLKKSPNYDVDGREYLSRNETESQHDMQNYDDTASRHTRSTRRSSKSPKSENTFKTMSQIYDEKSTKFDVPDSQIDTQNLPMTTETVAMTAKYDDVALTSGYEKVTTTSESQNVITTQSTQHIEPPKVTVTRPKVTPTPMAKVTPIPTPKVAVTQQSKVTTQPKVTIPDEDAEDGEILEDGELEESDEENSGEITAEENELPTEPMTSTSNVRLPVPEKKIEPPSDHEIPVNPPLPKEGSPSVEGHPPVEGQPKVEVKAEGHGKGEGHTKEGHKEHGKKRRRRRDRGDWSDRDGHKNSDRESKRHSSRRHSDHEKGDDSDHKSHNRRSPKSQYPETTEPPQGPPPQQQKPLSRKQKRNFYNMEGYNSPPGPYDSPDRSPPGPYDSPSDSEEDMGYKGKQSMMGLIGGDDYHIDPNIAMGENQDIFGSMPSKRQRKAEYRKKTGTSIFQQKTKKFLKDMPLEDRPMCRYFMEGKCHKGNGCLFRHDFTPSRKRDVCKFYMGGSCVKGNDCLFMHADFPCKFYHTGSKCFQGDNCKFSHDPLNQETREILQNSLDPGYEIREPNDAKPTPSLLGEPPIHLHKDNQNNPNNPPPDDQNDDDSRKIPSLFDLDIPPMNRSPNKGMMNRPGFYNDMMGCSPNPPMMPPMMPPPMGPPGPLNLPALGLQAAIGILGKLASERFPKRTMPLNTSVPPPPIGTMPPMMGPALNLSFPPPPLGQLPNMSVPPPDINLVRAQQQNMGQNQQNMGQNQQNMGQNQQNMGQNQGQFNQQNNMGSNDQQNFNQNFNQGQNDQNMGQGQYNQGQNDQNIGQFNQNLGPNDLKQNQRQFNQNIGQNDQKPFNQNMGPNDGNMGQNMDNMGQQNFNQNQQNMGQFNQQNIGPNDNQENSDFNMKQERNIDQHQNTGQFNQQHIRPNDGKTGDDFKQEQHRPQHLNPLPTGEPISSGAESQDESKPTDVTSHLPEKQREMFKRIQMSQQRQDEGNTDKPATADDSWYSSDDEDNVNSGGDATKHNKNKMTDFLKNIAQNTDTTSASTTKPAPTFDIMQMLSSIRSQATQSSTTTSTTTQASTDTKPPTPSLLSPPYHSSSDADETFAGIPLSNRNMLDLPYKLIEISSRYITRAYKFHPDTEKLNIDDAKHKHDPRVARIRKYITQNPLKRQSSTSGAANSSPRIIPTPAMDPRTASRLSTSESHASSSPPGDVIADPRSARNTDPRSGPQDPRSGVSPRMDPRSSDPRSADPRSADPRSSDPRSTDPRSADPRTSEPRNVDPRSSDPRTTDPRSTDPRSTDPRTSDPRSASRISRSLSTSNEIDTRLTTEHREPVPIDLDNLPLPPLNLNITAGLTDPSPMLPPRPPIMSLNAQLGLPDISLPLPSLPPLVLPSLSFPPPDMNQGPMNPRHLINIAKSQASALHNLPLQPPPPRRQDPRRTSQPYDGNNRRGFIRRKSRYNDKHDSENTQLNPISESQNPEQPRNVESIQVRLARVANSPLSHEHTGSPDSAAMDKSNDRRNNLRNNDPRNSDPRNNDPRNSDPRNNDPRNSDPRNNDPRNSDSRQNDPRNNDPRTTDIRNADPRNSDPRQQSRDSSNTNNFNQNDNQNRKDTVQYNSPLDQKTDDTNSSFNQRPPKSVSPVPNPRLKTENPRNSPVDSTRTLSAVENHRKSPTFENPNHSPPSFENPRHSPVPENPRHSPVSENPRHSPVPENPRTKSPSFENPNNMYSETDSINPLRNGESPVPPSEYPGRMAGEIPPNANEPPLKDLFKNFDPTASPFC